MSTITNTAVSTTATNVSSQSAKNTSVNQTEQVKNDDAKKNSVKLDGSEIVVSSRAQKLKALASEFFTGGINGVDIKALKERAYEYGLISKSQYNSLTKATSSVNTDKSENTTQSLAEELNKVEKQIEKRNSLVPEAKRQDVTPVTSALNKAAVILKDPEEAITNEQFKSQIATAIKDLKGIIDSDTFGNLPVDERATITSSASALSVIESLAPRNLTNDKLNKYLANSFS